MSTNDSEASKRILTSIKLDDFYYSKSFINSLLTIRETYPNQTTELWDRLHALKKENDHLREMYSKVHSLYEAATKNQNNVESILCNSVH